MKKIDDLRKIGVIPKWAKKYSTIKRIAQLVIQKQSLASALDESKKLIENIKVIYDQLKQFQNMLTALGQQIQRISSYLSKLESKLGKEEKTEAQNVT
jgi:septal ring factor EnvC (AmiA/AmiB activator)